MCPRAFVAVAILASWTLPCPADDLAGRIGSILNGGKKSGVQYSVHVVELPDGKVLYDLNADRSLKPASNMKLATTAAAIEMLGIDFAYRTILARRGDDLLIVGSGDPATGDPRLAGEKNEPITAIFHRWADSLRKQGIAEIAGRLLIDDSVFESTRTHPCWKPADLDNWFAAPVGGLNFNDNCVDAKIQPASKPGGKPIVQIVPHTESIRVENRCRSGGKGKPSIGRKSGQDVVVLRGNCPKKTSVGPVAVHDPGMLFAGACRAALVAKGIKIGCEIKRVRIRKPDGTLPGDWTVIATHTTSLPTVVTRCNKASQNLFAECLLKTLGYHHGSTAGRPNLPEGSWTAGRAAVRRFLMKIGVSPYECVIDDGSGLSHDNRLSAAHLTSILRFMFNHAHRDVFVNSLAVSGRDGTLKHRMGKLAGQVHAKTGYVSGVRTLSGYVRDRERKNWACFSILVNGIRGSTRPYADVQDRIVQAVAKWLEKRSVASSH